MSKLYAVPTMLSADAPPGLTPPLAERTLSLTDETATSALSAAFVQAMRVLGTRPVQVQLSGDLGVGKTTLPWAILRGLEHTGCVCSPTCTLVEPYDVVGTMDTQKVYHLDLYRFADPEEWTNVSPRDCFAELASCPVKWPEKVQALLDTPDLYIALSVDVMHETYEGGAEHAPRAVRLSARTQTGLQLL